MSWTPSLVRSISEGRVSLSHVDVDDYLEVVAARTRPNTLLAVSYDVKVFFTVVPRSRRWSLPVMC
jgi:integrase/recombinase XerD